MLAISALKSVRTSREYPRALLAKIAGIEPERLKLIELRKAEPWYDEALAIARALNVSIHDLLVSGDLTTFEDDPRFFSVDFKFWQQGVRLPLSIALRLQRRFGIPTVDDLDTTPLMRQLWEVLEAGERLAGSAGMCPWCQSPITITTTTIGADTVTTSMGHADTCTPHLLLGARSVIAIPSDGVTADPPLPGRRGSRVGSAKVPGLRAIRENAAMTQAEMAAELDFAVNHYARVERCELPLVLPKADRLCSLFNISRDVLFGPAGR